MSTPVSTPVSYIADERDPGTVMFAVVQKRTDQGLPKVEKIIGWHMQEEDAVAQRMSLHAIRHSFEVRPVIVSFARPGKTKRMETVETLFDDESTRKKFTVMDKINVMVDDSRNNDYESFWVALDDFLVWGKSYRITIEELP